MKSFLAFFLSIVCCFQSIGQAAYDVKSIPDSLRLNANAVVRKDSMFAEIVSLGKYRYYSLEAITILNTVEIELANFAQFYDKSSAIRKFQATVYNAIGVKVKSYSKSDLKDKSYLDNSLITDNRIKYLDATYAEFPYTVVFEYEYESDNMMFLPDWDPMNHQQIAVEKSTLQMAVPKDYDLRFKALNGAPDPKISLQSDQKIFEWQMNNQKAMSVESNSAGWRNIAPMVVIAPSTFEIEGYKGNMSTWKQFGDFILQLNAGKSELPIELKNKVQQLIANCKTQKERIAVLYKYLQDNTHYVSIQLGIGGWQPFPASFVYQNKYGDCKALSNFMYALLQEAKIPSYYTLVNAGSEFEDHYFMPEFCSANFSHIILCVPEKTDTTWLECTSQFVPMGFLGTFTDNRYALLITPEGGKLVRTPIYDAKWNRQIRTMRGIIDENGRLSSKLISNISGILQEDVVALSHYWSKEKMQEHCKSNLSIENSELKKYSFEELPDDIPSIREDIEFEFSDFAQISGKRLFIQPNLISRSNTKYDVNALRRSPIVIEYSFIQADTVYYSLPPGFTFETVPENININCTSGTYHTELSLENDQMQYIRTLEVKAGTYPADKYKEIAIFYHSVYQADRKKVALLKEVRP
ncbi:MAG: DUF3857 domain-containing protein [Saprospiraceae bacterium]